MSLSCPERIAAAIPAEVRASRIARAGTFAAVHESGSGPTRASGDVRSHAAICGRADINPSDPSLPIYEHTTWPSLIHSPNT